VGAVLVEPVLGRGGVVVAPPGFLTALLREAHDAGALLVADEIWTGLGRSGAMLQAVEQGALPDLVCLGKGLGGGLPMSACVGGDEIMHAWRREAEVVHTSTFAGAPLSCATAIATLDVISRERLVSRSKALGASFLDAIRAALSGLSGVRAVRGAGLMIGVDLGARGGIASVAAQRMLEQGYITSTGGGGREVLVLTPPLTIAEAQLDGAVHSLADALRSLPA
jgi:4-aminobutyrate aminotransferase/(S)-3-amino-2-methylpropionate transaminase